MRPIKFQLDWPVGSGEDAKNRFSRWLQWPPPWTSDRNYLAVYDLQVTTLFPTKFQNWPFISEEEAENIFLRWRPSWILDRTDFRYF